MPTKKIKKIENMKTNTKSLFMAVVSIGLISTLKLHGADFYQSDLTNQAIASSPRAREEFPQLTRPSPAADENPQGASPALLEIMKNHALASSPRLREIYPELRMAGATQSNLRSTAVKGESPLSAVLKNSALAKSPRTLEQFPELTRGALQYATNSSPAIAHN
ncbi:MAG TPA: hypothetical protein VH255_02135 [Verrucomicrobiae bacterium]|jgi:hypothetical protein|nr:hypothetical protein [Verrucomicrobiae bacterium]